MISCGWCVVVPDQGVSVEKVFVGEYAEYIIGIGLSFYY